MEYRTLTPHEVSRDWKFLSKLILTSIDMDVDGAETIDECYHCLMSGDMQCHVSSTAIRHFQTVVITQLTVGETAKIATICYIGTKGKLEDLRDMMPAIEDWARVEECTVIRIHGRPAWKKIFPDYQLSFVAISKRL